MNDTAGKSKAPTLRSGSLAIQDLKDCFRSEQFNSIGAARCFALVAMIFTCLLCIGCNSSNFTAAATQSPKPAPLSIPGAVKSTLFGMIIYAPSPSTWPDQPVGTMGKIPGTTWYYIDSKGPCGPDPAGSCYDWSVLDQAVSTAEAHGVPITYTIDHIPNWAEPNGAPVKNGYVAPANWQYLSDFVTALATRYKGKIKYYEEFNEPDSGWKDTTANLLIFDQLVYQTIKAIDPNALVGSPGWSGGFLCNEVIAYYQAGGNQFADFAGYHPYGISPAEATRDGMTVMDWDGKPFLTGYDWFRSMMDANGLAGKPILLTEGGWGNNTQLPVALQPAYVARWFILFASAGANGTTGVTTVEWYGWNVVDTTVGWGTLDGTYGNNPAAGIAYGQVYDWLVGASFNSRCSTVGALWTCPIERASPSDYQALIVWNEDSTTTYLAPSGFVQYRDLAGNTHVINGPISLGDAPILLENQAM